MQKRNSTSLSIFVITVLVLVPVFQALPLNLPPLLPEASAQSSITINNVNSTSGTVSSSPYQITLASFNAGTGSNRTLIVGVEANNQSVTSVKFGTTSLTQAVGSFHNEYTAFWYLNNPSGTANIVVTMAGATQVVVGAYELSGVDQTNPIPTTATRFGSGNPTVSLNTLYSGSIVLDSPSIYGGSTLSSPTCTSEWNHNITNKITGASSNKTQTTPGSVTCSWTASVGGDGWDDSAIEVKAAGTASPATSIILNSKSTATGYVGASGGTVTIYNFNPGSGSNRLLLVSLDANWQNASSIKFGTTSLTKAISSFYNNEAGFWYLKNPSSTPANLVVTMAGGTQHLSSLVVGAYAFSGVNQTTPIPTTNSTHNTSVGSPSISITTKYSNSWALDSPSIYGGATLSSPTCAQQWNSNMQYNSTNKITGASSSIIPATTGKVTCSWTASTGELYDDVAVEVSAETPSSWHSSTGVLEPLYCDPYGYSSLASCNNVTSGFAWQPVNNTKSSYPHVPFFAIANPSSGKGPGSPPNCVQNYVSGENRTEDYINGIGNLTKAGVAVLGYVWSQPIPTGYESTTLNWVEANITNWVSCFPKIQGIFLDGFPSYTSTGNQTYYQTITSYIHGKGLKYSFGNPGNDLLSSYQGTVDLLNIYEGHTGDTNTNDLQLTNNTLQGNTGITGNPPYWHTLYGKNTYSFLRYNQSSITQHMVQNASAYVGLEYFTDMGTPTHQNPWNSTATYLTTEASYLSNQSVLSTIMAQDTSGNAVSTPIQIYQSGNLVSNQTTPFTYNSTSTWQFKFTGSHICKWTGSVSNSSNVLYVSPTSSGVYTATYSTSC